MSSTTADSRLPGTFRYSRPRIKREHQPLLRVDGSIQIGGDIPGIASVIDEPEPWLWDVLRMVDGTRPAAGIVAESGRSQQEIDDTLAALSEAGFLEDAATEHDTTLSPAERDRYSRSRSFHRWIDLTPRRTVWEVQERIKAATVTVLGVGGSGSSLALALAAAGVGRLHLVDDDVVEPSNLTRQFLYAEADVGRPKVDAAAERLRALNSAVEISCEKARVGGPEEIRRLAEACDVFALCADRPREIQHWTAIACAQAERPWATSGYVGPLVRAETFVPGTGPCFECLHLRFGEVASAAPALSPHSGRGLGNDELSASNSVSGGLAGLLLAHAVLAHITGAPALGANLTFGLNLAALDDEVYLAPERHPDCPLCGDGRPLSRGREVTT